MSKWFKSLGSLKARSRNYIFPSAPLFSPVPVKFATNLKILRISLVVVANFLTAQKRISVRKIRKTPPLSQRERLPLPFRFLPPQWAVK